MQIQIPSQQTTKTLKFSSFQMIIMNIDASLFNNLQAGKELFNILVSGTVIATIGSPESIEKVKIYNYGSNDTEV